MAIQLSVLLLVVSSGNKMTLYSSNISFTRIRAVLYRHTESQKKILDVIRNANSFNDRAYTGTYKEVTLYATQQRLHVF